VIPHASSLDEIDQPHDDEGRSEINARVYGVDAHADGELVSITPKHGLHKSLVVASLSVASIMRIEPLEVLLDLIRLPKLSKLFDIN